MSDLNQAAFARPFSQEEGLEVYDLAQGGLTKREYAAIHLRVPMSGNPELDAMIREAVRRELAARAIEGFVRDDGFSWRSKDMEVAARLSYEMAAVLLTEGEK